MPVKPSYEELSASVKSLEKENAELRQREKRLRGSEREYQQILENTQERYQLMIENAGDMIFTVNENGDFTYISPNCETILGFPPDAFLGQNFISFVHPADVDEISAQLIQFFNTYRQSGGALPEQVTVEYRALTKDGKWKFLSAKSSLLKEKTDHYELVGIARDITEQKQAEIRLRESEAKYRDLILNAQDVFYSIDLAGTFMDANEAFLKEGGWSREDIIGRNFMEMLHPEDTQTALEAYETSNAGNVAEFEMRAKKKNGKFSWYSYVNRPLYDQDGNLVGITGIARNIDQRKQAEEALSISEQRLRLFIDSSPDFVFLKDNNLRYELVNIANAAFFGLPEAEIIGKSDDELMSQEVAQACRDTDLQAIREKKRIISHQQVDNAYYEAHKFPVIVNGEVRGVAGIIRDITDRQRIEDALRKSEEKYRTILEEMADGYFEVDLKGNFTFFNEAMRDMLGYSEDELMGMNYRYFADKETAGKVYKCFNTVYRAGIPNKGLEWELIRKNGSLCHVETSVSLSIDPKGRPIGFKGVSRDSSERKQAEREKEQLQNQLRHAQKMEAVGTLAGGIAHDFNNILSSVIGYAELALDDAEEASLLAENLLEVLRAGNRAKDLVKQILVISRQKEQAFQPIQINPLLKETITLLRKSIPASIDIQQEITSKPMVINTDPAQLTQVIVNLVANAQNAIPDDSGWIEIRAEWVVIDENEPYAYPAIQPGNYAKTTVKDSGIGISAQDLEKIFDPYFTTREKRVGGIGLGLSIVHGIVERHEGYIKVDSEPGKGTAVNIYLPLVEQSGTDESADI